MRKISSGFGIAVVVVFAFFWGGVAYVMTRSMPSTTSLCPDVRSFDRAIPNKAIAEETQVPEKESLIPSGWKTYENDAFAFRLSCPSGYVPAVDRENIFLVQKIGDAEVSENDGTVMTVTVTEPGKFGKTLAETPTEFTQALLKKGQRFSEMKIDGKVAYKNSANGTYTVFLENSEGRFARYDFSTVSEVGNRILTTFTFPKGV